MYWAWNHWPSNASESYDQVLTRMAFHSVWTLMCGFCLEGREDPERPGTRFVDGLANIDAAPFALSRTCKSWAFAAAFGSRVSRSWDQVGYRPLFQGIWYVVHFTKLSLRNRPVHIPTYDDALSMWFRRWHLCTNGCEPLWPHFLVANWWMFPKASYRCVWDVPPPRAEEPVWRACPGGFPANPEAIRFICPPTPPSSEAASLSD